MIDIAKERLVLLRDAPRYLPPRPNGKRLHISAIYRWISRGVGGVVLESATIGGSTYTSVEALQRFAQRLSAARSSDAASAIVPPATAERRAEDLARQVAERLGLGRRRRKPASDGTDGADPAR